MTDFFVAGKNKSVPDSEPELLDELTHGRGHDMQLGAGAGKGPVAGGGLECAQGSERRQPSGH